MIFRLQSTRLQSNLGQANRRLERWAGNPWRRLSLRLIGLLIGFLLGTAITTVSGALGQIDPVAALLVVIGTEFTVRLRRPAQPGERSPVLFQILDMSRIGLLYGLFLEAFKLI
jgi:hypothetical protein